MPKSTAPLTQPMLTALQGAQMGEGGHIVVPLGTRSGTVVALINRGLVTAGRVNTLTDAGKQIWSRAQDPLEQDPPVEQSTGDRYAAGSMSADTKARDAAVIPDPEIMHSMCTVDSNDGCIHLGDFGPEQELPQRTPGKALTQELTGEQYPLVNAGRPGMRTQILLRAVTGEVLERVTRETFIAVGSVWGRLEGRRVRIGCMDGDVFQQKPLQVIEDSGRELDWKRPQDSTVHTPVALMPGTTVLVDGCRVYQMNYMVAGDLPRLLPVK